MQTREATYSRLSAGSGDRTVTAGTLRACPRAHNQAIEKRVLVGVLEVQCRSTTGALPSATTPTPTLQITSGSPRRISTSGDRHGSGRDCEFGDFGPCCSHDPESWCRRNHSDTLVKLIRRHNASEGPSDTSPPTPPRTPDQDFRENLRVGGGTLTPVFRVPTRSNPDFRHSVASRRRQAAGRRSLSNSSRHRRQYPSRRCDPCRSRSRRSGRGVTTRAGAALFAMEHGPLA